jgi:hypothetical protein
VSWNVTSSGRLREKCTDAYRRSANSLLSSYLHKKHFKTLLVGNPSQPTAGRTTVHTIAHAAIAHDREKPVDTMSNTNMSKRIEKQMAWDFLGQANHCNQLLRKPCNATDQVLSSNDTVPHDCAMCARANIFLQYDQMMPYVQGRESKRTRLSDRSSSSKQTPLGDHELVFQGRAQLESPVNEFQ